MTLIALLSKITGLEITPSQHLEILSLAHEIRNANPELADTLAGEVRGHVYAAAMQWVEQERMKLVPLCNAKSVSNREPMSVRGSCNDENGRNFGMRRVRGGRIRCKRVDISQKRKREHYLLRRERLARQQMRDSHSAA